MRGAGVSATVTVRRAARGERRRRGRRRDETAGRRRSAAIAGEDVCGRGTSSSGVHGGVYESAIVAIAGERAIEGEAWVLLRRANQRRRVDRRGRRDGGERGGGRGGGRRDERATG